MEFQQNRLNAFVTITKTQAMDNIKELKISDEEILKGIPGAVSYTHLITIKY